MAAPWGRGELGADILPFKVIPEIQSAFLQTLQTVFGHRRRAKNLGDRGRSPDSPGAKESVEGGRSYRIWYQHYWGHA
eukprot:bmy_19239T0